MDITDILSLVKTIAPESAMFEEVVQFVGRTLKYSRVFAGGITSLYVAHKVVVSFLKPNEPINPSTLVRPVLILAVLGLYQDINEFIIEPFANSLVLLAEVGAGGDTPENYLGAGMRALTYINAGLPNGTGSGIFDFLQVHPLLELIHLLIFVISSLVVFYIYMKQIIVRNIYYVLGIFVLPLSLIPGNEKAINKWFFGYLSVLLWIPILHVLMYIINAMKYTSTTGGDTAVGVAFTFIMNKFPIASIAFQVMMIFLVLNIPKYANIIVGGEGSEIGGIANAIKKAPGRIYGGAGIAGKALKGISGKNK